MLVWTLHVTFKRGGWSIAKPSSKACARPSAGGRRPARFMKKKKIPLARRRGLWRGENDLVNLKAVNWRTRCTRLTKEALTLPISKYQNQQCEFCMAIQVRQARLCLSIDLRRDCLRIAGFLLTIILKGMLKTHRRFQTLQSFGSQNFCGGPVKKQDHYPSSYFPCLRNMGE